MKKTEQKKTWREIDRNEKNELSLMQVTDFGQSLSSRRQKTAKLVKKMEETAAETEDNCHNIEERKQTQNITKKTFRSSSLETPWKVKTASNILKKETPGKIKNLKRLNPITKTPSKPRSSLTPRKQLD